MAVIDGMNINGNAYDLRDKVAVRYNEAQTLTDAQKEQAKANIGAADAGDLQDTIDNSVHVNEAQNLTAAQKAQARGNIGAVSIDIENTALLIGSEGSGDNFYNQWAWSSTAGGTAKLTLLQYTVNAAEGTGGHVVLKIQDTHTTNNRRSFAVLRGVNPLLSLATGEPTVYYPVPVPSGATKATATLSDPNQYLAISIMKPVGDGQYDAITTGVGWYQGVNTVTFEAGNGLVLYFQCRYNSTNSAYPSGSDPEVTLVFE